MAYNPLLEGENNLPPSFINVSSNPLVDETLYDPYNIQETPVTNIGTPVPECPEGYVFYAADNTCVPIEVAKEIIEEVKNKSEKDGSEHYPGTNIPTGINYGNTAVAIGNLLNRIPTVITKMIGNALIGHKTQNIGGEATYTTRGSYTPGEFNDGNPTDVDWGAEGSNQGVNSDGDTISLGYGHGQVDPNIAKKAGYNPGGVTPSAIPDYEGEAPDAPDYSAQGDWGGASFDGHGNVSGLNKGGLIAYRAEGGSIPGAIPVPSQGLPGAIPAGPSEMPPQMPQEAPMAAPMPPARKTFAEKVAEAKEVIKNGGMSVPKNPQMSPQMDAQGDGPIYGDFQGGQPQVAPDMGVDTVDAKLAPGEFVMNKEATEANMPALEAMNSQGLAMRNGGMVPGYNDGGMVQYYDRGGRVKALLNNPNLSSENRKILEGMMVEGYEDGGEVEGSFFDKATNWATDNSDKLGKLGKSLVQIGQRDFTGASDALSPDAVEDDTELSKQDKVNSDMVKLAEEAHGLLKGAAKAGDFINGHNQDLTADEEEEVKGKVKAGLERFAEGIGALVSTGAAAFNQTARVREEALQKIAVRKFPNSYNDYIRLKAVANKMVFPILESGALGINPTDADVELARQATFDITAASGSWALQLNDLITRSGGEIVNALAAKTGNQDIVASVASGKATVNTSVISAKEKKEVMTTPEELHDDPSVLTQTAPNKASLISGKAAYELGNLKKNKATKWLDKVKKYKAGN